MKRYLLSGVPLDRPTKEIRLVPIEIDVTAANDPASQDWLNRILNKMEDGWHIWDTTKQASPTTIQRSLWLRDPRVHELHVASIKRNAWTLAPHGRSVRVTTIPSGNNQLTPEQAARLAEEPLWILVENRRSDGAFVERVVTELDKALHKLWRRPGEPIRFDSLGGAGQMADEIRRRTRGKNPRPRLVAIIDSDRKGPDDTVGAKARSLLIECQKRGVPCWILAKREAENYLPRTLLSARQGIGVSDHQKIDAWDRLNDLQKNFFDMNNGLSSQPSEIEEELFSDLHQANHALLSDGFGANVYQCWCIWNVQAKHELDRRGQGDLQRGIALIRKEV